jgi:hypothetical protein
MRSDLRRRGRDVWSAGDPARSVCACSFCAAASSRRIRACNDGLDHRPQRPAQYWLNAGLVELTAPSADLAARVDDWFATHLAPKSAAALRHAAAAVRTSVRENVRVTLPVVERLYLEGVMGTHDAKEGLDAFMQKRAPRWLDR